MNINKAFKIIEDNIDKADFSGSIASEAVKQAEDILGIKFPNSYLMFLEKYGAGDIAGIEIFGIIKNPATDSKISPNGIWLTQNLREKYSLPNKYVVISETGDGSHYVIDTSIKDHNNESPVFIWYKQNQQEKVSDSFSNFLFDLLKESL